MNKTSDFKWNVRTIKLGECILFLYEWVYRVNTVYQLTS